MGRNQPVRQSQQTVARVQAQTSFSGPLPPPGDLDYLGLNYYRRDSVAARSDRAFDWDIGRLLNIAISPDGLRAAAGSDKGRIVIWDLDV